MREYELKILDSLATIAPNKWDALTDNNPTVRHAFLQSVFALVTPASIIDCRKA